MKFHCKQISLLVFYTMISTGVAQASPLSLSNAPLFLSTSEKANVLVILDNSNSMDEAANGSAAGSANPTSKSEIARAAVQNLIATYTGKINLGLMAYQQSGVVLRHLHNAPYDASFDPANYDVNFTGARDSLTKRFSVPNVSNPGSFIYYNIALPFYSGSNSGNAYCYSNTADFDNGSETWPAGPWDSYRCFRQKTSTSDTLPTWGGAVNNATASEVASGFSNHWFNTNFLPTDSDLAQNILDFGRYLTWDWVSETWFSNSSPGRGYLHTPIEELDQSHADTLDFKLDTSRFTTNGPTDPMLPLQNAGHTPLEGTLLTAKDYFASPTTLVADEGGPAATLPESCDKDFIALLTDGLPSTDASGNTVSVPATALAAVESAAAALYTDGIETYMIGFALPVGTAPTTLDAIAAAGGTGTAYLADNPTSLQVQFDAIFADILDKVGAAASAATNSTSLNSGSRIFQARFNSGDWSGQLLNKTISTNLYISTLSSWDAGDVINTLNPNTRKILTISKDTTPTPPDGIPFRWSNITAQTSTVQEDFLNDDGTGTNDGRGSDRVDFLRGSTVTGFRTRTSNLGDIVHSAPFYVGAPSAGYFGSTYAAFRSAYLSRTPIIYVGANDGMLHGFAESNGEEVIAYVPGPVYKNLSKLTHPSYGDPSAAPLVPHRYFVDGTPMVADAEVGGGWKTVLVGGLNGGGQGYYALDITDPTSFSDANAASTVLWEFTDENDADLGYTYNQPTLNSLTRQAAQIAKMNNGKWAVIVGNGYNNSEADGNASSTGHAVLFILYLTEGSDGTWSASDYKKIDTGVGSPGTPNGLSSPTPVDVDLDGDIDFVYAGDLEGNVWRFDVTNPSSGSWSKTKLYTAKDSLNNIQPITTAPLAVLHPNGGYVIGFGTGKYLQSADLSDASKQTFYGIWDNLGSTGYPIAGRSKLVEQEVVTTKVVYGSNYRSVTDNQVDYTSANERGWYMDLPTSGERVAYNPLSRDKRFVFVTLIPDTSACSAGGTSWLMELNYLTGGRLDVSPFDVNRDGIFDSDDQIDFGSGDENAGGVQYGSILSTPTVMDNDETQEVKILSSSSGAIEAMRESIATWAGRISWKEITGN